MAKEGGFFSGSAKKDNRIAGNLGPSTPIKNYGGNMGFSQDFGAGRVTNVKPKKGFSLKDVYGDGTPRAQFFSPSGNEIGQIASATTDLSGLVARDTSDETKFKNYMNLHGLERNIKSYPPTMIRMMKENMRDDEAEGRFRDGQFVNQLPSNYKEAEQQVIKDNEFNKYLKNEFGTDDLNYGDKQFLRESFNEGNPYQRFNFDQSLKAPATDTKIALGGDNLGSYGALGLAGGIFSLGLKGIQSAIEGGKKLRENLDKKLNPESIQDKVGGFFNRMTGISPVAAGTLDANQQVSQVSERPKLSYVNPDAKTMSLSEIGEAFKPKNLFGYKDKFGRFDDPGSPLARDRAETIQRVAQNFSAPITADARTIGQIRADQEARMRENAKLRYDSFKRGERVQQKSADVTYGTNMLSNPAFGFRDKMTDDAKAKYDQSAKDATEMARTDPSLGNVAMQTINRVSGFFGGPQASLEKIGERQLRLANKEINRPAYQKEAYARKFLGITNDQLKAKNIQRIKANAEARTRAFNLQKAIKASEKSARRLGGNIGTGRDGGFGTGTEGKGLPSNPKGFSGYSRKSSPSTGTGTGTSPSRSRGGISKSTSRGQGGGPSSRSKGGTGTGKSSQGSKSSARGARGSAGSRGRGGTGSGGTSTSRSASKASKGRTGRGRSQCDIRTKIDITSLTNQNLMKDDLATIAYFVQELRGN